MSCAFCTTLLMSFYINTKNIWYTGTRGLSSQEAARHGVATIFKAGGDGRTIEQKFKAGGDGRTIELKFPKQMATFPLQNFEIIF
jgi:hypothetical protein